MFDKRAISRTFSVLFIIGFLLAVTPLQAAQTAGVRYAKPAASGSSDCSSWDNACNLQTALTGATSGDEIWATAGMYKPTTGTDRTATFQLKNGVALYGGFAGTETARDQRNPATNATILSGDLNGDDNGNVQYDEPTRADNSYHVVSGGTGATLDGFTITAGNASDMNSNLNHAGGGMYNDNNNVLTVTNVTFSANSAYYSGGGMNNLTSNLTLTNVTVSGNAAYYGGGMYSVGGSHPTLMNVTFSGNSASLGGGMDSLGSPPTLTNVTFSGNSAEAGGGMYNAAVSGATLTNVTFSGNSASSGGGGMYNTYFSNVTSSLQVRNSIFWGNTAPSGAQIYNDISTVFSVSYSVVQGGYAGGTHIIAADPKLEALGNYGGATQTIPLLAGSSAIDTGNDAVCPATDQRGVARPQGAHCDIGAYEWIPVDTTAPMVNAITRLNPSPTNLASVGFSVTFSEAVTGVDVSDFSLTTVSIADASVSGVSGSGSVYTVTVNTGTGSGTLRLDVSDDDSIVDMAGNPLGGTGAGNGNFTGGETYEVRFHQIYLPLALQNEP